MGDYSCTRSDTWHCNGKISQVLLLQARNFQTGETKPTVLGQTNQGDALDQRQARKPQLWCIKFAQNNNSQMARKILINHICVANKYVDACIVTCGEGDGHIYDIPQGKKQLCGKKRIGTCDGGVGGKWAGCFCDTDLCNDKPAQKLLNCPFRGKDGSSSGSEVAIRLSLMSLFNSFIVPITITVSIRQNSQSYLAVI